MLRPPSIRGVMENPRGWTVVLDVVCFGVRSDCLFYAESGAAHVELGFDRNRFYAIYGAQGAETKVESESLDAAMAWVERVMNATATATV